MQSVTSCCADAERDIQGGSHAADSAASRTIVASTWQHVDMIAVFSEVTRLGGWVGTACRARGTPTFLCSELCFYALAVATSTSRAKWVNQSSEVSRLDITWLRKKLTLSRFRPRVAARSCAELQRRRALRRRLFRRRGGCKCGARALRRCRKEQAEEAGDEAAGEAVCRKRRQPCGPRGQRQ